ncbi:hypothetical protein [Cohaesibacter gelatinilyticus]|uniref:Uncharacterized protein n=1 Tax=Cohaesibacter gelatinilyticus TaxID=372072 RepID=A0A285ND62_9HYPH|nr:hypothetical protein [Cohaesibacter gelatinilyticus]SNZ07422.1 hypothetical protein SAMN06265368_0941 [Cohaesibacter gelatinilyticus]
MTLDPTKPPSLTIDWDTYGELLENSDLSDEQKHEFIQTLWSIVVSFVDLGFGTHPLQQLEGKEISFDALNPDDVISLSDSTPNLKTEQDTTSQ